MRRGSPNGGPPLRVVPDGVLQGWRVSGPTGTGFDLRYAGRRYRVLRSVDDPGYVMIDLEFDTMRS